MFFIHFIQFISKYHCSNSHSFAKRYIFIKIIFIKVLICTFLPWFLQSFKSHLPILCMCIYVYRVVCLCFCYFSIGLFGLFFPWAVRNLCALINLVLCQPYSLQIFIPHFITHVFWFGLLSASRFSSKEEFIDLATALSAVSWECPAVSPQQGASPSFYLLSAGQSLMEDWDSMTDSCWGIKGPKFGLMWDSADGLF